MHQRSEVVACPLDRIPSARSDRVPLGEEPPTPKPRLRLDVHILADLLPLAHRLAARAGELGVHSQDETVWLSELDRRWQERYRVRRVDMERQAQVLASEDRKIGRAQ